MGVLDFLTGRKIEPSQAHLYELLSTEVENPIKNLLLEQIRGIAEPKTFSSVQEKTIGLPHPENYKINEALLQVPLIAGMIDKTVDFTVGMKYYFKSENDDLVDLCNDMSRKFNFDVFLRSIVGSILTYGNQYNEINMDETEIIGLKSWNPNSMYAKVDDHNDIIGYSQYYGQGKQIIPFEPKDIMHFKYNVGCDGIYGISMLRRLITSAQDKLSLEKDMAFLMKRKANSPLHVQVGRSDLKLSAIPSAITTMAEKLKILRTKNEFVTSDLVNMKVIDFGNIGDKFKSVFDHTDMQLVFGGQVPLVLLGAGNIPEGLAQAQMDAFKLRIQSIQLSISTTMENTLLRILRELNGYENDTVDMMWGNPEGEDKNQKIDTYTKILNASIIISNRTRNDVENELRTIIGLEPIDQEAEYQEPEVPEPPKENIRKKIIEMSAGKFSFGPENTDIIEQYIGYDYSPFIKEILKFIRKHKYEDVTTIAKNKIYLLKNALRQGFIRRNSISTIRNQIMPLIKDAEENVRYVAERIARTEIIRASNEGALDSYEESDMVDIVEFLATGDERTCDICSALDGKQFKLEDSHGVIPGKTHVSCRCTFVPQLNRSKIYV